tara:strand:- start:518 stop:1117 length:600 start_codon:yes stop_codon:yes gene_type:complete
MSNSKSFETIRKYLGFENLTETKLINYIIDYKTRLSTKGDTNKIFSELIDKNTKIIPLNSTNPDLDTIKDYIEKNKCAHKSSTWYHWFTGIFTHSYVHAFEGLGWQPLKKLTSLLVLWIFMTLFNFAVIGDRIDEIKMKHTLSEKLLASAYVSTQLMTTAGLVAAPNDDLVRVVFCIEQIIMFFILLFIVEDSLSWSCA